MSSEYFPRAKRAYEAELADKPTYPDGSTEGTKMFTVSFFEIDRAYGGPEEGGWWYDTGALIRVFRVAPTEAAAWDIADRANRLLNVIQRSKRDVGSVLYSGGRYCAEVHENFPPQGYPEQRPIYD